MTAKMQGNQGGIVVDCSAYSSSEALSEPVLSDLPSDSEATRKRGWNEAGGWGVEIRAVLYRTN